MPSNIEIKAKADDLDSLRTQIREITTEPVQILHQEDIFFNSPSGRLKLRIFDQQSGQLIYYERPDTRQSKQSDYEIYPTTSPRKLEQILTLGLGKTITVIKRREVYMVGQTRVHLDQVLDLGNFMELEVVLRPGQGQSSGVEIAEELMRKLGIAASDLISWAYADLLAAQNKPRS